MAYAERLARSRSLVRRLLPLGAFLLVATAAAAQPTPSPSPSPAPTPACAHQLRFVNRCQYPVWLAELGNTTSTQCTDDTGCSDIQFCSLTTCTSDTECPAISCTTASDCPGPSPSCVNDLCTPTCNTSAGQCYCKPGGPACPGGSTCQGTAGSETCQGGLCTFETVLPKPSNPKRWRIHAAGGGKRHSMKLCMPAGWGGRFWARTACTDSGSSLDCVTGQCGTPDGDHVCTESANGVTLFEPTFDADAGGGVILDYYDVSLVGGYNVPMRVVPSVAGCPRAECTSDLKATCPRPLWVTSGTCSTSTDCPEGGLCRAGQCVVGCSDPCDACKQANPPAHLRCDKFEDLYCCAADHTASCNSASATCFDDADCQNLSNGQISGTCDLTTHLCKLACTTNADCPGGTCDTSIGQCAPPLVSCESTSCPAGTSCDASILAPAEVCVPEADCCGPFDPHWLRAAKKAGNDEKTFAAIFKEACPAAYSFQYDDPSSLYTCDDTGGDEVDYTIVFCP